MPATKDVDAQVILVNEQDEEVGRAEKLAAHQQGLLHRAFSVFVFREKNDQPLELLLQQRARGKYHSPLLWTNTCCSHPGPGETVQEAAKRRLNEELGLNIPEFKPAGQFQYIAHFENGLTENELDHVLVAKYQGEKITPNPEEIETWRWVGIEDLKTEMLQDPTRFTPWLAKALELAVKAI